MKPVLTFLMIIGYYSSILSAQNLPTPLTGTFTDNRDGRSYKTIKIGDQWWMAENLAWLPAVTPVNQGSFDEKAYYVYGYSGTSTAEAKATANYPAYGVLYNWPAAMNGAASGNANPSGVQGACPTGWHLPSDAEWYVLSDYLINNGYGYEGSGDDIAKAIAAKTNWNPSGTAGTPGNDPNSNNSSGFSALPGGFRMSDDVTYNMGFSGSWWSSTENSSLDAQIRDLFADSKNFRRIQDFKDQGFSVRCIRDASFPSDTLTLEFNPGWNIFSINSKPENPDLKAMFKPLIDDGSLVIILDENGKSLVYDGDSGGWINNIGDISPSEGYKVKLNKACRLSVSGERVTLPLDILLKKGWNIIGFPQTASFNALSAVQPLIDRHTLVKVQDEKGNAIEDYGDYGGWINNIGDFEPGKGYKIKVGEDEVFTMTGELLGFPFNPVPPDFAMGVDQAPVLAWQCSHSEGEAITFDVYFGLSADALEPVSQDQSQLIYTSAAGLKFGTPYFWKVKAKDSQGHIREGPVWRFTVMNETGTLTDSRDNKTYKTVKIGNQVWMSENLAWLPAVSPPENGSNTDKYYYVYGYAGTDTSGVKERIKYQTYGVLYNWPAAMDGAAASNNVPSGVRGACPAGWHIPSDPEWDILFDYLGTHGYGYHGSRPDIAKALSEKVEWYTSSNEGSPGNDKASNNSSGFSAMPGGTRDYFFGFRQTETHGYWWSATELNATWAWYRSISNGTSSVNHTNYPKESGYSVRCLKD